MNDMGMNDMGMNDMGMNDMQVVPPTCLSPIAGQLVINEVLANPEGNESSDRSEWVEIVNVTDTHLSFDGLTLWEAGTQEVTFASGCIAPHSALVIYNQKTVVDWVWSSPPTGEVSTDSMGSFTITNSVPLSIELKLDETIINQFNAAVNLIQSGVSINRNPDTSADGDVALHNTLEGVMSSSSEGVCINGATFESNCFLP